MDSLTAVTALEAFKTLIQTGAAVVIAAGAKPEDVNQVLADSRVAVDARPAEALNKI